MMWRLAVAMLAVGFAVCPRPACAEAVYEFVTHCRQESLGDCFGLISERLDLLNGDADRRICLPRSFGGAIVDSSVPVSLLEHVRVKLSAARFGHAGSDVNDMIARIINDIYPCRSDRAGLR